MSLWIQVLICIAVYSAAQVLMILPIYLIFKQPPKRVKGER